MNNYKMEDLLPIVADLSKQYTCNESSSIPYEKARMLMAAVVYCIEEYDREDCAGIPEAAMKKRVDPRTAYEAGCRCVVEKVHKAKVIYEKIAEDFPTFGCLNCKDTILEGIPAFFLWYDVRFKPQNHLLTLDYPTLRSIRGLCGIDAIYQYLINIETEWTFLRAFPEHSVISLLDRTMPDYEELFLDNICGAVLRNAVGCVIADRPITALVLLPGDLQRIESCFRGKSKERIRQCLDPLLDTIIRHGYGNNTFLSEYIKIEIPDFACAVDAALKNNCLGKVFV